MPYLRLSSLELPAGLKRQIAAALTDTVVRTLPHQKREWTTVHFQPYRPDDFAIAGQLAADGVQTGYHLEVCAPGLNEQDKQRLVRKVTPTLAQLLGLGKKEQSRINIKFSDYDPANVAIGGKFLPELNGSGMSRLAPIGLLLLGAAWIIKGILKKQAL